MHSNMPLRWHAKLFIYVLGAAQLGGTGTVKPTQAAPTTPQQHGDDPWSQTYRPGDTPPTQQQTQPQQGPTLQLRGGTAPAEDTDPEQTGDAKTEEQATDGSAEQATGAAAADSEPASQATHTAADAGVVATSDRPEQTQATTEQPQPHHQHPSAPQEWPGSAAGGQAATPQPASQTGVGGQTPTSSATVPNQQSQATPPQTQHLQTEAHQHAQAASAVGPHAREADPTMASTAWQPSPHQRPHDSHPQGWMPGRTPKDAWGFYAPAYDPDTDPWHQNDEDLPHPPQQPHQEQRHHVRQGAQQHVSPAACAAAIPTPSYTFPYDPWEDELDEPTPRQLGQQQPTTMVTQPTCPAQIPTAVTYIQPPEANRWGYTLTYRPPVAPTAPLGANQPQLPTAHLNPQATAPSPHQQPIRNRWGRALAQHPPPRQAAQRPSATGPSQANMGTHPPQRPMEQGEGDTPGGCHTGADATNPHQAADWGPPPWEQPAATADEWSPPPWEAQGSATTPQTQTGTQADMPQGANTDTTAGEAPHPSSSSHEQPPPSAATADKPMPAAGADQSTHQSHSGGTTAAEGGIPPNQELEEEPVAGQPRGGTAKPYHEGRGDQRMRGKRFKAAVQQAFAQRGWDKNDDQTWKQVAYMVDLYEEDDEEVWAKVLAAGPQRRPGQRPQPTATRQHGQQEPRGGTDWGLLLNLHTMPRGTVGPAPGTTSQKPQPTAATQRTAAAGEPPGEPRRRREASSSTQPLTQPSDDVTLWDGLYHTMLLSHGGAPRPLTFPPELFIDRERRCTCAATHMAFGRG